MFLHIIPAFKNQLPYDFMRQLMRTSAQEGKDVRVSGKGVGSLEPEETAGLDYRVTVGSKIDLPWLWQLYEHEIPAYARDVLGIDLYHEPDEDSRININYLNGRGKRYENHVDSNTCTALLWVTPVHVGGRFIAQVGDLEIGLSLDPAAIVLFTGNLIPHHVEPLSNPHERITVPMNYYLEPPTERPVGLTGYLHGND